MSLNLFDVPDMDYRYETLLDVAFQPALTGTRPITSSIPASDDYYDLHELCIQVKVRLTDPAPSYQGLKAKLANSDGTIPETRTASTVLATPSFEILT